MTRFERLREIGMQAGLRIGGLHMMHYVRLRQWAAVIVGCAAPGVIFVVPLFGFGQNFWDSDAWALAMIIVGVSVPVPLLFGGGAYLFLHHHQRVRLSDYLLVGGLLGGAIVLGFGILRFGLGRAYAQSGFGGLANGFLQGSLYGVASAGMFWILARPDRVRALTLVQQ